MSAGTARYSERARELFFALPHAGALPAGPGELVAGEAVALDRGAWIRFEARIEDGRIADCRFRAWGCPHTLAAAALVATLIRAGSRQDAAAIDAARLACELHAPAEKLGRLLVVEDALRALLAGQPRVQ